MADINNGVTDVFHREFATDVVDYERTLIDTANAAFAGAYAVGDTDNDPTLSKSVTSDKVGSLSVSPTA